MTSDLVVELADQCELLRGTGEAIGLTWEAGDTPSQRTRLIDMQGAVADLLRARGWAVQVGVERPRPGMEVFAIRIDPDDQDEPEFP
jgi:hypothetical protein